MGMRISINPAEKAPFSRGSRADGSNPRAVAAAVKATAAALKSKETLAKVEAHALWLAFQRPPEPGRIRRHDRGLRYHNRADPPVLIAPSRFLRDHIRTQFRQRLERFDARIRVGFTAAADAPSAPVNRGPGGGRVMDDQQPQPQSELGRRDRSPRAR